MKRLYLQQLEQLADPTRLTTLNRLARARERTGWRYQQKTVEDWIRTLALAPEEDKNWGRELIDLDVFFARDFAVFEEIGIGAVPALIGALRHADWRIRRGAANLLDFLGPNAQSAAPALAQALADPHARVIRAVLKALLSMEVVPASVVPHLLSILRRAPGSPEAMLAARASAFLRGAAAEEVLPLIIKGLRHANVFYRSAAARALGQMGMARAEVIAALSKHYLLDTQNTFGLARALAQLAPDRLSEVLPTLDGLPLVHSLFALAHLGREAGPLFPAVYKLYQAASRRPVSGLVIRDASYHPSYLDEALLLALAGMGHWAAEAIPLLLEQYHSRSLRFPVDLGLRAILIDTFLEAGRQEDAQPAREQAQVIERVRRRGASRRQEQVLARLEQHPLTEHDLLRQRVALGDLPAERLELAAALGYQPAMRALAQKLPRQPDWLTRRAFSAWAEGLARFGMEARARIGHALGRSVLPFWLCEYPGDLPPQSAVIALENWLYTPDSVRRRYGSYVERAGTFQMAWPWTTGTSAAAGHVIQYAASQVSASPVSMSGLLDEAVETWLNLSSLLQDQPRPGVPLSRQRALARVRQTVRELVVPWALGRRDPIRAGLAPLGLDPEALPPVARDRYEDRFTYLKEGAPR